MKPLPTVDPELTADWTAPSGFEDGCVGRLPAGSRVRALRSDEPLELLLRPGVRARRRDVLAEEPLELLAALAGAIEGADRAPRGCRPGRAARVVRAAAAVAGGRRHVLAVLVHRCGAGRRVAPLGRSRGGGDQDRGQGEQKQPGKCVSHQEWVRTGTHRS